MKALIPLLFALIAVNSLLFGVEARDQAIGFGLMGIFAVSGLLAACHAFGIKRVEDR